MVSRTRGKYFKQGYISEPFCFDIFGSIYLGIKLHSNFVGYHFNHLHFGDLRSDFSYLWILLSATKTVLGGSPTKHPPCCRVQNLQLRTYYFIHTFSILTSSSPIRVPHLQVRLHLLSGNLSLWIQILGTGSYVLLSFHEGPCKMKDLNDSWCSWQTQAKKTIFQSLRDLQKDYWIFTEKKTEFHKYLVK